MGLRDFRQWKEWGQGERDRKMRSAGAELRDRVLVSRVNHGEQMVGDQGVDWTEGSGSGMRD